MLDQLNVYLEAVNPEKKYFRAYNISCGQDLLGAWLVQTAFGRIGTRGTVKNYAFDGPEKAQKHIKALLKKRFSAQKRIGCNYEIKSFYTAPQTYFEPFVNS